MTVSLEVLALLALLASAAAALVVIARQRHDARHADTPTSYLREAQIALLQAQHRFDLERLREFTANEKAAIASVVAVAEELLADQTRRMQSVNDELRIKAATDRAAEAQKTRAKWN